MIKLPHMVLALILASCILVTITSSRIFYDFSSQLEKETVQLYGESLINQFRQDVTNLVTSTEERQFWVSSIVADIDQKEDFIGQLESALENSFLESQILHYELLLVTDLEGNVVMNYSSRSVAPEGLLSYLISGATYISDMSRVRWEYENLPTQEFLVKRIDMWDRSREYGYKFYAGIRLTGPAGYMEMARRKLNARFLALAGEGYETVIATNDDVKSFKIPSSGKGILNVQVNGEDRSVVMGSLEQSGVFSKTYVAINTPDNGVRQLSEDLQKSYYWLLLFLLVYIAVAFAIIKYLIGKSVSQVLLSTHELVNDGDRDIVNDIKNTKIHEFSQLLQNFYVLLSRLRVAVNKHKEAEVVAVEQARLLSVNKVQLEHRNELLNSLNEQMEQFVYSTSHDLKSPLTSINGLSQFALIDLSENNFSEVNDSIVQIQSISASLSSVIEDVINVMKAEKIDVTTSAVSLQKVVQSVWKSVPEGVRRGVDLQCDFQHEDPIQANQPIIEEILKQLLDNAAKYRDPDQLVPLVRLDTAEHEGCLSISVSDNGVGISESFHDKVFELFQKYDRLGRSGSGLGLSLVKKYAEKAGGSARYTPMPTGSRFCVILPVRGSGAK